MRKRSLREYGQLRFRRRSEIRSSRYYSPLLIYFSRFFRSGQMTEELIDSALEFFSDRVIRNLSEQLDALKNQIDPHIDFAGSDLSGMIMDLMEEHGAEDSVRSVMEDCLERQIQMTGACERLPEDIERQISQVAEVMEIGNEGISIIRSLYCLQLDWHGSRNYITSDRIELMDIIARFTLLPVTTVRSLFSSKSPLRKFELLENQRRGNGIDLSDEFLEFLQIPDQRPVWENLLEKDEGDVYHPEDFSIRFEELEVLKGLLSSKKPVQIFFYGTPGTGKTELARSLARSLNRDLYFITTGERGNPLERRLALEQAVRKNDKNTIYCFDEADSFLNTINPNIFFSMNDRSRGNGSMDKSWINDFLERNQSTIIWIANHVDNIEESVARRFHYSLHFEPLSAQDRYRLWERLVSGHKMEKHLDSRYLRELARSFPVNTAGIKSALDLMNHFTGLKKKDQIQSKLEEILRAKTRILTGKNAKRIHRTRDFHVPELLETSVSVNVLYEEVRRFFQNEDRAKGLHFLFYGPPGTGKSKLIFEIASSLGREIQVERASSLMSPYVGMTERLIRGAFENAERSDGILLIDEVDTFLFDRAGSLRSWEASMVNEFLDAMESFRGILAATTNRIDGMDQAALRRFQRKVEFKALTGEKAAKLLLAYAVELFGKKAAETFRKDATMVSEYTGLTPGDFAVVFENIRGQSISSIESGSVARDLHRELELKRNGSGRKIGFVSAGF